MLAVRETVMALIMTYCLATHGYAMMVTPSRWAARQGKMSGRIVYMLQVVNSFSIVPYTPATSVRRVIGPILRRHCPFLNGSDIARAYNLLRISSELGRYFIYDIAGAHYQGLRAGLGWRPLPAIWSGILTKYYNSIVLPQNAASQFWKELVEAYRVDKKNGIRNPCEGMLRKYGDLASADPQEFRPEPM